MTTKLSITQCPISCSSNHGSLIIRLRDKSLYLNGTCRFVPINVESQTSNTCGGKVTYVINYDETLLQNPGTTLTANDFDLICVDAGDEYAIEAATECGNPGVGNTSVVTDTISGHLIANHNDGTGLIVPIHETVTSLAIDENNLEFTDESGTVNTVLIPPFSFNVTSGPENDVVAFGPHPINTGDTVHFYSGNSVSVESYTGSAEVVYGLVLSADAGQLLEFGADNNILLTAAGLPVASLVLDGTDLEFTDLQGTVSTIPLCPVVTECETLTSIAFDPALSIITYLAEDGTQTILNLTELNDTSVFTNTVAGHRIGTHDDGDGTVVDVNETVTTVTDNGNNSFTYVNENSVPTTVDFSETVTDLQINPTSSGLIYINEDGQNQNIDLCPIVDNCETVTSISLAGSTISFSDENGAVTGIDLCPMVKICETVTGLTYEGTTGDLTYTDESGVANVVNIPTENFLAAASYDSTTKDLTLTLTDGTVFTVNLADLVDPETVTTLTDNGNSTFTYVNEAGASTTVDYSETDTTLSLSGTNLVYTPENGIAINVDICPAVAACETVTAVVDNGNDTFTYTNESGTATTIDFSHPVAVNDTSVVTNVVAGHLIATHSDGAGTVVNVNETVTTVVDNGNSTFTYTNENGSPTIIDYSSPVDVLTSLAINPAVEGLLYTDEVGSVTALDLCPIVANCETVTTLVDNGNDTFTYVSEAGTITTVDFSHPAETDTTLVVNGAGDGLTYTPENGVPVNIDLCPVVAECETVTSATLAGSVITYTNEDGVSNGMDLCPMVKVCETVTGLAYNGTTGDLTYTDEDGADTVLNIPTESFLAAASYDSTTKDLTLTLTDGTVFTVNLADLVDPETVTTLTDNGNDSFTYINEAGTPTTVDYSETVTSLALNGAGDGLTYTDEAGVANNLVLCPIVQDCETVTALSIVGDTLNYTDEAGNLTSYDLCVNVASCETVTNLTILGNVLTYTREDGVAVDITLPTPTETNTAVCPNAYFVGAAV